MKITTNTLRQEDQFSPGMTIVSQDELLTLFTADLCRAWSHKFCLELAQQQQQRWALSPQGVQILSHTGCSVQGSRGALAVPAQVPGPSSLSMAGGTAPKARSTHLSCPVRLSPQQGMLRKVTWPSCWHKPRAGWEVAGDLWITRLSTSSTWIYSARGGNSSCSDFWWKAKE